jgi:hypothetical protein
MKTQTFEQHTQSGWLMNTVRFAVVAVTLACSIVPAMASINLNSSRSNVYGYQPIDPGQLGPAGTPVESGDSIDKNFDLTTLKATFAFMGGGSGQVGQQGSNWAGNFAPGDFLLWTNSPGQGPLALQFNLGLAQVGAQIQPDFYGPFVAAIAAYDANGNPLGYFTEAGVSNGNGDGSAIFLGVDDTVPEIRTIVYSIVSCTSDCNDFAINDISFSTGATPEPGTLALFGSGVLGFGGLLRRRLLR